MLDIGKSPYTIRLVEQLIAIFLKFCSFNSAGGAVMTSTGIATNCTFDGLDRLTQLGYEVGWLWYDIIALALFSTLFLTIAYLALLLIKK